MKRRMYTVALTLPPSESDPVKKWRAPLTVYVLTESAERAVELVKAKYPTADIHNLSHTSLHMTTDVIIDAIHPDSP